MWETKYFKTYEQAKKFMYKNKMAKGGEIEMYDKIDYVDNVSKQKVKAEVIGIDEDGYTIKYKLKTPKGDMKMFKKKVKTIINQLN